LHAARCAALVGALAAGHAFAQVAEPDAFVPGDEPDFSVLAEPTPQVDFTENPFASGAAPRASIGSRSEKADGSVSISAGEQLPTEWDTKIGVDVASPSALPQTLSGPAQDRGAGWASVAMPAAPIGLDKASIDARIDPSADQGNLSTFLARSLAVGAGASLTLQNGYSVTQTLANPTGAPNAALAPARIFSGTGALRLELPTATAFSAGASLTSSDDRVLPRLSAEQKLFGTPFSITGAISERPGGDTDKSITAGFKQSW
jgi:hypothetical protein